MILLMLGPPGSGKGTQSELLVKNLNYHHISIGEILRVEVDDCTQLGLKIKNTINSGNLVDDATINELLEKKLQQYNIKDDNIIIDGYPRSLVQAVYIFNFLVNYDFSIISLNISKNEIINRLLYRVQCNKCKLILNLNDQISENIKCSDCGSTSFARRKDDSEEIIVNRLDNFDKINNQIIDFYKQNKTINNIDASQPKSVIYEEIVKIINKT